MSTIALVGFRCAREHEQTRIAVELRLGGGRRANKTSRILTVRAYPFFAGATPSVCPPSFAFFCLSGDHVDVRPRAWGCGAHLARDVAQPADAVGPARGGVVAQTACLRRSLRVSGRFKRSVRTSARASRPQRPHKVNLRVRFKVTLARCRTKGTGRGAPFRPTRDATPPVCQTTHLTPSRAPFLLPPPTLAPPPSPSSLPSSPPPSLLLPSSLPPTASPPFARSPCAASL